MRRLTQILTWIGAAAFIGGFFVMMLGGCAESSAPASQKDMPAPQGAIAQDRIAPWDVRDTNDVIAWQVESTKDFVTWTEVPPEWAGFDTRFQNESEKKFFRLRGITE